MYKDAKLLLNTNHPVKQMENQQDVNHLFGVSPEPNTNSVGIMVHGPSLKNILPPQPRPCL